MNTDGHVSRSEMYCVERRLVSPEREGLVRHDVCCKVCRVLQVDALAASLIPTAAHAGEARRGEAKPAI